jgi:hypothetical protein
LNIKRKEILSILVCIIFVLGCFSTSASVTIGKGSTNTHRFINVFGHCDDLHIKYNKVITSETVDIDGYEGAIVFEYEVIEEGYMLLIVGLFPQGSSLEITVQSDEPGVLFPVSYVWTIGGVPASPDIPVRHLPKPFYGRPGNGNFKIEKFVDKPIAFVQVWVTKAKNILGGKDGVTVTLTEQNGGTLITFSGVVNSIFGRGYIKCFIDPPGVVFDEIYELNYNVEFKGLIGTSVSILNVGETVENLDWSIDLSGLVFMGKHTEGTINSFPTNSTEVLRTGLVFGFGPSIITANIGDSSINASCFILGPLILGIKQPPA